jgi:hypothetical protein
LKFALAAFVTAGVPAIVAFAALQPNRPSATLSTTTTTTTTMTGTPTPHIIAPFVGVSLADEKLFAQQLNSDVGEENVQTILKPDSHVGIWYAPLNQTLIRKYKANPIVRHEMQLREWFQAKISQIETVELDSVAGDLSDDDGTTEASLEGINFSELDAKGNSSHLLSGRDGVLKHQPDAPQELKIVSQPKADLLGQGEADYAYLSDGGAGIAVYVFDTGASVRHPVRPHLIHKWREFSYKRLGIFNCW